MAVNALHFLTLDSLFISMQKGKHAPLENCCYRFEKKTHTRISTKMTKILKCSHLNRL